MASSLNFFISQRFYSCNNYSRVEQTPKPTPRIKDMATSKKQSENGSKAASVGRTAKKTTTKSAKKTIAKSAERSTAKSTPNPHTVRPERYDNYPSRGPVTLTYRNPRARQNQQLTLWVHVDQAIHWMERGLWHHLTPMREGCEVLHIGVGGRFMP